MKYKLLFFLLLICLKCYSQSQRKIMYGTVKDSIENLSSVHIINLNTNQGTYTNDSGEFRILANVGDTIQLSFIGYKTKNVLLQKINFGMSINSFVLQRDNEVLDEVIIKKNNLTGLLALDVKNVPKDKVDELVKEMLAGIMAMDLEKVDMSIDEMDRAKAPIVNTDPILGGATLISTSIFTSKKKILLSKRLNKLKRKEQFYKKLFTEVSKDYFIKELHIPNENIYHFVDYCNYKTVEKLFNEDKILDLLKLFETESIAYLQTIKN